ncbi:MAG: hypothetical protein ACTSWN_08075, partial [Promethearchaeota archaeon]
IDADRYLIKYSNYKINNIINELESVLVELISELKYESKIKVFLIENCLESLLFCNLEVIWKTRQPRPKKEYSSFPDDDEYKNFWELGGSHCPKNKLKKFTEKYCEHKYNERLHPEHYGKKLDISIVKERNQSFSRMLDTLSEIFYK